MLIVGGNIAIIMFNWVRLVNAPRYLNRVGFLGLDFGVGLGLIRSLIVL